MKFSYQWLAELVPSLNIEPGSLERGITMKTAECDGIETSGMHFGKIVAAMVVSIEAMPSGKNKLAVIDVGGGVTKPVVCGAGNIRVGMIAAWVPPGTQLADKLITEAFIDGVESQGMLASASELGINRDHSGLLELTDVEPGQPIPGLHPDSIIEIDNKSLTHRPDLWGHYGMAREVAAITHNLLRDPVDLEILPVGDARVRIDIQDYNLCSRYSAVLVENTTIAASPLWLQARLESVGLNPINNLVDVTNYVLAELPQPMHAYDADKLHGGTIFVRLARQGEILKALNGQSYELTAADLVIADEAGPVGLAGVIGGAESAISQTTKRVVLESANFDASSIRLSSARHKLRTDASMRFEKSLDPQNTIRGLARAIQLLQEVSPEAKLAGGVADNVARQTALPTIYLPLAFVAGKLGKNVSKEDVRSILSALGFGVTEHTSDVFLVTVPSWRATKDVSLKDDLVEEIGRMIGYGEIEPRAPLVASVVPPADPMRSYLRWVRLQLAAQGFTEVYNYSFVNEQDVRRFALNIEDHIAVCNPIASEQTHLRKSLLPGLFNNILSNVRHRQSFRIFEIGNEIHPSSGSKLPRQQTHAAAVLYNAHGGANDFFELKAVVEVLLPQCSVKAVEAQTYEHPARAAEIHGGGICLGRLFELHPFLLQEERIPGRVFVFDIDLQGAQQVAAAKITRYQPVRKFPTSGFDLSVIARSLTPVAEVGAALRDLGGPSVVSLSFVDQYAGPPLSEGQKSVSYHIEIGASDRTLTAEQVGEIRTVMIDGLRALGYELRA